VANVAALLAMVLPVTLGLIVRRYVMLRELAAAA